jgi:methylation protein EvaC
MKCRACNSFSPTLILDFGLMSLAGAFLKEEKFLLEKKYPLTLVLCTECYLLQVGETIDVTELFEYYFYSSSNIKTLVKHYEDYANYIHKNFSQNVKILEIGCNDGVLLNPLSTLGFSNLFGVDPASNITADIGDYATILNDYFGFDFSKKFLNDYGKIDIILANNVFAHVDDINDLVSGIKFLLSDDGIFIFEVHGIESLISDNQFDMVYHEHVFYYSTVSLDSLFLRHRLRLFDIMPVANHGGSIRYHVCHDHDLRRPSEALLAYRSKQVCDGYTELELYNKFSHNVNAFRTKFRHFIDLFHVDGKVIYGYGASGRASTFVQYVGIDNCIVRAIVDDSPLKQGFFTPGSHIPIISYEEFLLVKCDILVLFSWTFKSEILPKLSQFLYSGGIVLIPLPKIQIYFWNGFNNQFLDIEDYVKYIIK